MYCIWILSLSDFVDISFHFLLQDDVGTGRAVNSMDWGEVSYFFCVFSIYVDFLRQGVWPVKKEGVADIGKQAEVLSVQVSRDLIILLHSWHISFFSGKWSAGARRAWALARRWSLMLPPSTPSSPGLPGSSLTNNIFHPQCCGTVRVGTLWSSRR